MSARHVRVITAASLAASIAGCATLGGNVEGDFDCRAPEGSCAPTTLIDSAAIGETGIGSQARTATNPPLSPAGLRGADARSLRIVIAAYRDAAGRDHEARIVHVALPDHPAESWHAPRSRGEVLRALGRAGDNASTSPPPTDNQSAPIIDLLPLQLPEVLVIPSQAPEAQPGVSAPVTGAPGRPPSPGRVPHFVSSGDPEGERQ